MEASRPHSRNSANSALSSPQRHMQRTNPHRRSCALKTPAGPEMFGRHFVNGGPPLAGDGTVAP
eukprot:scaffold173859_cov15-Tisochrysis_lutea.AAC.1